MTRRSRLLVPAAALIAALSIAQPAFAGPPFICHPLDIGAAASLPWGSPDARTWANVRTDYDVTHLVADTLALLTPETPILVRMETLRRATIYASRDANVAGALYKAITGRAVMLETSGRRDALAYFDAGFIEEAFTEFRVLPASELPWTPGRANVAATDTRARELMDKSLALRPADPAIHFALALMSRSPQRDTFARKARESAHRDPLVIRNLHYIS